MSESKREKNFSLGSFLFMPQFRYSFQGAAHLYPVFIQLLASVFVATEMLPKNHPAMRYGSSDVKEYSFREICGEAWYHLRRKRATPRQWAMYFSVLLMIFCFATAIVGVTSRVFLGIGAAAQAQIFMIPPSAACTGACNTDLENGMSSASTLVFDKRMDKSQMGTDYNDWGLFMLDKIVRESAQSTQKGGRLQNAFSAIILTYNTAITVVAAVMIFWIILSVVVDTAKTGILGGGRHNMVWAPIRIVFALGLMIPLGTAGYSSGQYCVMKLAEWGSNLGTNGWTAYVTALAGGGNEFLAPVYPKGYAALVGALGEMRLCQVTYNSYVVKATNPPSPKQLVYPRNTWSTDGGTLQHALTNNNDSALCGALQISAPGGASAVTFPSWSYATAEPIMGDVPIRPKDLLSGTASELDDSAIVSLASTFKDLAPLGAAKSSWWTAPTWAANPMSAMTGATAFNAAAMAFRKTVAQGTINTLTTVAEPKMLEFACSYAARHVIGNKAVVDQAKDAKYTPGSPGTTSLQGNPLCNPSFTTNGCNATPMPAPGTAATGTYDPDYSCHQAAIDAFYADNTTQLAAGGLAILALFSQKAGNIVLSDATQYGWASAGSFYNKITQMNTTVQSMSQPIISYVPGKLGSAADLDCNNSYSSVGDCRPTGINYETAMVLHQYTRWYEEYATNAPTGALNGTGGAQPFQGPAANPTPMGKSADKPFSVVSLGWSLIKGGTSAVESLIKTVLGKPDSKNGLLVNLIGDVSDNTLPLANLAKTGIGLSLSGGGMLFAASLIQGLLGTAQGTGVALANSMIFSFITATASSLITAGITLTFFVPILPFLRAAFATLTWMVSIFEAVVMIPIAALAHLTTEGEGLAAGARQCWILWLNVLVRPILYVMGFIGAFIVYNAFVCYFTVAFSSAAANSDLQDSIILRMVALFFNTTVYVGTCYAAANSVFKMVDIIPNALMRWMPGGAVDHSFDDTAGQAQGYANSAAGTISRGAAAFAQDTGYGTGKLVGTAAQKYAAGGVTPATTAAGRAAQTALGALGKSINAVDKGLSATGNTTKKA